MISGEPGKLIAWSEEFSVGIPSIDAQHRKLFALINDLHAAMACGRGAIVVSRTLVGLLAYTSSHFVHEEKLLAETAYPAFHDHKAEHARLLAAVKQLQSDLLAGKSAISLDVLHFLKDWLRRHILGMDQKYARHLQAAGAK